MIQPNDSSPQCADRTPPLLQVRGLSKWFPVRKGLLSRTQEYVRAADEVSFVLDAQRTLGLVGESGCGKSTVGRTMLRLLPATSGEVLIEGEDILQAHHRSLKQFRQRAQFIFQDPYGSLNPRMTVRAIVGEPLRIHHLARGRKLRERVAELLTQVGLGPDAMTRYPHEFSGGQRQRIGIARAIALNPALVVCDEPTSALDVSVRAQVINLLKDLQEQRGIAYLFISHDLAVVRHLSHQIAVMYLGRIVETADTKDLFTQARHPYTRLLLESIPVPRPSYRRPKSAADNDEIPSPIKLPSGCPFHPRCPLYEAKGRPKICRRERPVLELVGEKPSHQAACHFVQDGTE